jgi:hypothetical protein
MEMEREERRVVGQNVRRKEGDMSDGKGKRKYWGQGITGRWLIGVEERKIC